MLKALKIMVDSNVIIASGQKHYTRNCISQEKAVENVAFLRTQTESWLSVFFNVFGSVGRDSRNTVGEVISSWAGIAGEQVSILSTPLFHPHLY